MATADLSDKCTGGTHTPDLFEKVSGPWKVLTTK
jgi:hypothetical protein